MIMTIFRILYHYEQSRGEALDLILALLPELERIVQKGYGQIDPTMERLRSLKGSAEGLRKLELWEILKLDVISRSIAIIYAVALVELLYSINLSIVGRLLYLRRLFQLRQIPPSLFLPGLGDEEGTTASEREILQSSRHFVQVGLEDLIQAISNSVNAVMSK